MKIHEIINNNHNHDPVDPRTLGTVTRDLPQRYFHFTHTQANVDAIIKRGFDLKMFGHTGKKFNMPDITRYDPAGVYCQDASEIENKGYQPWVEFTLAGSPLALTSPHVFFRNLATAYHCVGKELSAALRAHGISVVQNVREFVILDVSLIHVVDWSGRPPS